MSDNPDFTPDAGEGTEPTADKPKRVRTRRPRAEAVQAEGAEQSLPTNVEAAPPAEAVERQAATSESDGQSAPSDPAAMQTEAEGGGARSRRRRRGRKGRGDRPEPIDGEAPQNAGQPSPTRQTVPMALPDVSADVNSLFGIVTSGSFDADAEGSASPSTAELPAATAGTQEHADDAQTLVGQPPADQVAEVPDRRVLAPDADAPKLQKVLAQSGLGSRRDLEQMIADGRVTVNGEPAHTGQRVMQSDRVAIDGKPVRVRTGPSLTRVLAYHKPVGEVVTFNDPQQRPTVFRNLPRLQHGKWQSVGRLDINTEGLLLFTTSGELANRLMHPRFGIQREYAVRVLGQLDTEGRKKLLDGVVIDGHPCAFLSIEDGGGEGANRWYRVSIAEGRHREVRRLFDAVGMAVSRLIRIRYGCVVLPRGLKRGAWVDLSEDDVKLLRQITGLGVRTPQHEDRDDRPEARGDKRNGKRSGRQERPDRQNRPDRAQAPMDQPRDQRDQRDQRGPARGERQPKSHLSPARPGVGAGQGKPQGKGRGGKRSLHEGFGDAALRAREFEGEFEHAEADHADFTAIPSPLQQTFDQRAARDEQRTRRELHDDAPIPNPLQQTFDQRALKADRSSTRQPQRDADDDGPIPNPLQQTYDKRMGGGGGGGAGAGGGRRGGSGGPGRGKAGPGRGKGAGNRSPGAGSGGGQPDPLRTAVGYIGADAARGKGGGGGRRGGGGGGGTGGRGGRGGKRR
jgi:23S rRNA pseudouridine2605 synthase